MLALIFAPPPYVKRGNKHYIYVVLWKFGNQLFLSLSVQSQEWNSRLTATNNSSRAELQQLQAELAKSREDHDQEVST